MSMNSLIILEVKFYSAVLCEGLGLGLEFLPRDARNAKRGIAIVGRPSVRLSVCNVDVGPTVGIYSVRQKKSIP